MKIIFYLATVSLVLCASCKEEQKKSASSSDATVQNEIIVDTIFRTRFVLDDQYIILEANPDTNWATGSAMLSSNGAHHIYSATKEVNGKLIPQSYLRLLNTDVQVANNNGKLITAKLKSFKLYSGYTPHSGEVQRWDGNLDDGEKPFTTAEKADQVWNDGTRYLVAALEIAKPGEEEEFVVAIPSTMKVSPLQQTTCTDVSRQEVLSLLTKTKNYDSAAKSYHKITGKGGTWWEGDEGREVVTCFKGGDGVSYTLVSHVGGDPCGGDYYFEKLSIWKSANNGFPELLYITDGDFEVMSVTDIDLDTNPEFVIDNKAGMRILINKRGNTWLRQYTREVPNLDCGC